MRTKIRCFGVGAIALASCLALSGATTSRVPACGAVRASSLDRFNADSGSAFTIQVPPGFRRLRTRSAAADIGEWQRDRDQFRYEYGSKSDWVLADDDLRKIERCTVEIDGRTAEVMTGTLEGVYPATFVGVHFPELRDAHGRHELTITGMAGSYITAGEILGSIHSIKFR